MFPSSLMDNSAPAGNQSVGRTVALVQEVVPGFDCSLFQMEFVCSDFTSEQSTTFCRILQI